MRDLNKELGLPNGILTSNATANLDPLYGPFLTLDDAMSKVLVTQRVVGKLLAISPGNVALIDLSYVDLYTWTTDVNGNWGAQRVGATPLPYQIITLGEIVTDLPNSKVTVNVDRIGRNQVRLNGILWGKNTINEFTIDPIITPGNFRKDIIEARPDSTLFFLKKGTESTNPVPPNVTSGGMLISEVLVTSAGITPSILTPATNSEAGDLTEPTGETNKVLTTYSIWSRLKNIPYLIMKPFTGSAIANRFWSNGLRLMYANASAVVNTLAFRKDLEPSISFTPTGNFNISDIKALIDANEKIFNGITVYINNGNNNYRCNFDIGGSFVNHVGIIKKTGSGTISFESSRILNTGASGISILNGNYSSFCYYEFSPDTDFIKIKNY